MDGYLAQLEQQLHRVQVQLDEMRDAAVDLLTTHRKKLADDKEKAFKDKKAEADKEAQEVAARIKKREDDRKAAIEQAKADAEKQLAEEFKAKTTDDIKAQMRAELMAKAKADADEEARVLAAGQAKIAAEADFKSRFGDPLERVGSPPVSPPAEKTTTFPTRPGVAPIVRHGDPQFDQPRPPLPGITETHAPLGSSTETDEMIRDWHGPGARRPNTGVATPSPAFTPSQPPDVPRAPGEFDPRYGGPLPDDRASDR